MPACHVKGPFSVRRPLRELQPGPPLNLGRTSQRVNQNERARTLHHITTSSVAAGFVDGKNLFFRVSIVQRIVIDQTHQKKSFRVSSAAEEMGTNPA